MYQHALVLKLAYQVLAHSQRIHEDGIIFKKLHEIEAPKGGRELVLLTPGHSKINTFDLIG